MVGWRNPGSLVNPGGRGFRPHAGHWLEDSAFYVIYKRGYRPLKPLLDLLSESSRSNLVEKAQKNLCLALGE